jgi:large subunit ribosomal protein L9
MEIILKEDIPGLGEEGDIKNVKDGYARNYLIPKKLAVLNNNKNRKILESVLEEINARKAQKREEARSIQERLDNIKVVISKNAGENGKLFGSVTNVEISEKFLEKGLEIDRRKIEIIKPIKVIGEHKIRIRLMENIQPEININVVRVGEELEDTVSEEELKRMEEEQTETKEKTEENKEQE